MGDVYGDLGEYEQALHYYGTLLDLRREIGDRRGERSYTRPASRCKTNFR
jgi:hypothetical protein